MNIRDVFIICDLQLIYHNDDITYEFFDVETGCNLIIDDNLYDQIASMIKSFLSQNNSYPSTICFKGHFLRDSENIYVTFMHSAVLLTLKAISCYINNIDNHITLIDDCYNLPVTISNADMNLITYLNELFAEILNDDTFNLYEKGRDRLLIIGKVIDYTDTIDFEYDPSLLIGLSEQILTDVYNFTQCY